MSRFRTGDDEWVTLEGTVEITSAKAVLFSGVNFDHPEWLPRSQIEIIEEATRPGELTLLRVKSWLCKKNGWN